MQKGVAWVSMSGGERIHEFDGTGREGGGRIVEGAISRGAWDAGFLQGMAAGSGFAYVDEQFGSRGCREAGRADRLWRNRSAEHTSGLHSRPYLVFRPLLAK